MECCERNDLIEPVGCNDGTLPPKLMAEFLHPAGVDQPPRTLAVVHPIPLPQSSTSIFSGGRGGGGAGGLHAAFYAPDIDDMSTGHVNSTLDLSRTRVTLAPRS